MKKIGRNDPCHCGSGKKFKKCCESIMIGGRYMATRLAPTSQVFVAPKLASLFHSRVSTITIPTENSKPIIATAPTQNQKIENPS